MFANSIYFFVFPDDGQCATKNINAGHSSHPRKSPKYVLCFGDFVSVIEFKG
jgi:hypothetical protein